MWKNLLGAVIYKIAPIHSGARFCQNLAANISNPPLLLPMPVAREISLRAFSFATMAGRALRKPIVVEFEMSLVNLTRLAVDYIQGAPDDIYRSKSQSIEAHRWLAEVISRNGINALGIGPVSLDH